uniref:Uncharacterized protein n=1 Tax=Rhizophora mucronata TaxID=61149 RepID=A0A2P2QC24_RHIMU
MNSPASISFTKLLLQRLKNPILFHFSAIKILRIGIF